MFENFIGFFKKIGKKEGQLESKTNKDEAKERLHLVLMQDRANVSADFLDMMRQEIIDVIKKYIDVEESDIDVRLTNKQNSDGTTGAPALYANIPIKSIKNETIAVVNQEKSKDDNVEKDKEEDKNIKKENKEDKVDNNTLSEENKEEEVNNIEKKDETEEKNNDAELKIKSEKNKKTISSSRKTKTVSKKGTKAKEKNSDKKK